MRGTPEPAQMVLLPPAPYRCQECAVKHPPEQPHNRDSLYYAMVFQQQHGRSPTWADAAAHCTQEMQAHWRRELEAKGATWGQKP